MDLPTGFIWIIIFFYEACEYDDGARFWVLCLAKRCARLRKGKAVPQHTYGSTGEERRYSSYSFTTSALLDGDEWSVSRPGRALAPGKEPHGTHCAGGWVGLIET
jgi:hypothetical protein